MGALETWKNADYKLCFMRQVSHVLKSLPIVGHITGLTQRTETTLRVTSVPKGSTFFGRSAKPDVDN